MSSMSNPSPDSLIEKCDEIVARMKDQIEFLTEKIELITKIERQINAWESLKGHFGRWQPPDPQLYCKLESLTTCRVLLEAGD